MVSGQLPSRKIAPRIFAPQTIALWMIAHPTPPPKIIALRTIASEDNCYRGKLPPDNCPFPGQLPPRIIAPEKNCLRIFAPWMIAPGLYLPDNYPKDNCPLAISFWKMPPMKIVFRVICGLHNCP